MLGNLINNLDSLKQTMQLARIKGWKINVEVDNSNAINYPRIARRLMETHLGQQYYTNRIEITVFGNEYYLEHSAEYRDGCKPELKAQVEEALKQLTIHIRNEGYINLQYWKEVSPC